MLFFSTENSGWFAWLLLVSRWLGNKWVGMSPGSESTLTDGAPAAHGPVAWELAGGILLIDSKSALLQYTGSRKKQLNNGWPHIKGFTCSPQQLPLVAACLWSRRHRIHQPRYMAIGQRLASKVTHLVVFHALYMFVCSGSAWAINKITDPQTRHPKPVQSSCWTTLSCSCCQGIKRWSFWVNSQSFYASLFFSFLFVVITATQQAIRYILQGGWSPSCRSIATASVERAKDIIATTETPGVYQTQTN